MENIWKKRKIYGLILIIAGITSLVIIIFYMTSNPNLENTLVQLLLFGLLAGVLLILMGVFFIYEAWRKKIMYVEQ